VIHEASEQEHEIGLHAWDHHKWQSQIEKMDDTDIHDYLNKGFETLTERFRHHLSLEVSFPIDNYVQPFGNPDRKASACLRS